MRARTRRRRPGAGRQRRGARSRQDARSRQGAWSRRDGRSRRGARRRRATAAAGVVVGALLLAGCGAVGGEPMVEAAATARSVRLVQEQVDAFNRHDAAAMAELVAEDFVWLAVTDDSVSVEVRGRDALEASMRSYFASTPDVRSSIEDVTLAGPFVAVRERASWRGGGGARSQEALGVYEVRDGLIRRVWYYPAER